MRIARATAVGLLLVSLLALGGCKKKKPPVPQPQAQAPTVTEPQPEPPLPAPAASEPNRPQPEQPESATTPAANIPATKPKPRPRKPVAKKTPPPVPAPEKPAENQPNKTSVPNGGTQPATGQLSANIPPPEASHQTLNTNQLLEVTDHNLKSINRSLTSDEQAMVQHIRSFMQQSRQAIKDGDGDLAYRLALKAHLLSDELVKR
jgi:hypothetical protein